MKMWRVRYRDLARSPRGGFPPYRIREFKTEEETEKFVNNLGFYRNCKILQVGERSIKKLNKILLLCGL